MVEVVAGSQEATRPLLSRCLSTQGCRVADAVSQSHQLLGKRRGRVVHSSRHPDIDAIACGSRLHARGELPSGWDERPGSRDRTRTRRRLDRPRVAFIRYVHPGPGRLSPVGRVVHPDEDDHLRAVSVASQLARVGAAGRRHQPVAHRRTQRDSKPTELLLERRHHRRSAGRRRDAKIADAVTGCVGRIDRERRVQGCRVRQQCLSRRLRGSNLLRVDVLVVLPTEPTTRGQNGDHKHRDIRRAHAYACRPQPVAHTC